jgi:hypothetical protein
MVRDDKPITSMSREEREEFWDDTYLKEPGIISEFNLDTHTGKVRSLKDGVEYKIDGRELVRTRIELHAGDKILFAPIESPEGDDFARVIGIIELNA